MKSTAPNLEEFRQKLKVRHLAATESFTKNHPHANSFFQNIGLDLGKIRQHSAHLLAVGSLSSALLLSPPQLQAKELTLPKPAYVSVVTAGPGLATSPTDWLVSQLNTLLPQTINPFFPPFLNHPEEKVIGKTVERATGIPAVATLEGEHLNTTYGYIAQEQHLMRYPGDILVKHDEFLNAGMAPGRGAWGWFTGSDGKLTPDVVEREKYYVAVQTLYLPDWNTRSRYLRDWYKWRKVVVVNPDNGQLVIAVVGDSGPAAWTGKHFGGSPEVMNVLGGEKYRKGRVLLFFVDDPENKIKLGPVNYSKDSLLGPSSILLNYSGGDTKKLL